MKTDDTITQYLDYIHKYGLPYESSDTIRIITDHDELVQYSISHSKKIGIVYKSEYNMLIVDLVEDVRGKRFTYERLVKTRRGNSVVIIPVYNNHYVLLKQFRHAIGAYQYAFPRGYGELNITVVENAKKEIYEELNATASSFRIIGKVVADSGICGEEVNIVQCIVDNIQVDGIYEGIKDYYLLSSDEIEELIKTNMITDGFTLSAWLLYKDKYED